LQADQACANVASHIIAQVDDTRRHVGVFHRMSPLHIARAHVEVGLSLLDRDSGTEANDGFQVMTVA
jgi:hypothetical protein